MNKWMRWMKRYCVGIQTDTAHVDNLCRIEIKEEENTKGKIYSSKRITEELWKNKNKKWKSGKNRDYDEKRRIMKKMDGGRKKRKKIVKVFVADLFMIEGIFT